jgi:glutamate synthase domain-containing protein 2
LRYLFESIRPEIQQYFVESDSSGRPFSRELRSVIYQRSKDVVDTKPFGTIHDLYTDGTEWIAHSLAPLQPPEEEPRILIGANRCSKPYAASILNISAMSFGSLSKSAILALNGGAKLGGFAHNTGEGGVSAYHLKYGGDLVWQIGTGYFGCRSEDGGFDDDKYKLTATLDSVRMIEIKLSQGAKPGHGGILPAGKITPEIAEIRGIPMGKDCVSPPNHSAFGSPKELLQFVSYLRELSGGKPIGIKLCIGRVEQIMGICKAMVETGQVPDFVTVDGSEGGTGAAPLEFSNSIGMPLTEGLLLVHNCLIGCGLRKEIKIIAAGKIATGFNVIQRIAIGADLCNAARSMMFALGCIQALKCNTNHCPVGVATQNPVLIRGLDVSDKRVRVRNFHRNTVHSALDIMAACGLSHPDELQPGHIFRRISSTVVRTYADVYDYSEDGDLIGESIRPRTGAHAEMYSRYWAAASADHF